MAMASLKCLIVLCMLHLFVEGTEGVNPAVLARIIQYFDNNVQPTTMPDAQYAIAIIVPPAQCTDEQSDIQTVFSREEAEHVRNLLNNRENCILCTQSENVIAARPNGMTKEHSEHILLYPLGNSPMDTLLAQADQNSCVVFYSYNSPCVTKCILSDDNILPGLTNWKNKREGMNVFVFNKIWQKDAWRRDMAKDLLKIHERLPLYRCTRRNVMECQNCINGNIVIPFCLPERRSVLLYFQKMFLSMIKSWHVNE
ncbi:uncharacterized protein LOC107705632 [Sinocyclocheilus rhinocerous]|uniref:uncharacterized protein LOC107705632 n=1 Tax=Sinocyclocheilus rhinocerous TaxID=307959 RepID=UPI0007BA36F9|nr:PREDICTED: uncharacterized protein LOC107705632 [Sinocyclocheilus rhinocerous]